MLIKTPLIRKTPLTNRWTCITRYKVLPNGIIEAKERYDIHDQIEEIIKQSKKKPAKKKA